MKVLTKSLATALAALPAAALAHPGHGTLTGLLHGFEPLHLLPAIAIVAVAYGLMRRKVKARKHH